MRIRLFIFVIERSEENYKLHNLYLHFEKLGSRQNENNTQEGYKKDIQNIGWKSNENTSLRITVCI
jgi:hypothetical protein